MVYYNEYNIETVGLKATRTINLVNWLRSQGAIVHGVGLQYHIDVSTTITQVLIIIKVLNSLLIIDLIL